MVDLGLLDIEEFGTSFGYEGEGGIVGLDTILHHLTAKNKGFLGKALIHSFPYVRVPYRNGRQIGDMAQE